MNQRPLRPERSALYQAELHPERVHIPNRRYSTIRKRHVKARPLAPAAGPAIGSWSIGLGVFLAATAALWAAL